MIAELACTLTPVAIAYVVWLVDRHDERNADLDDQGVPW